MRKHTRVIAAFLLAIFMSSGYALAEQSEKTVTFNEQYGEARMAAVDGKMIDLQSSEQVVGDRYMGFAFLWPEEWSNMTVENMTEVMIDDNYVMIDYVPERCKADVEQMRLEGDDERWEALYEKVVQNSLRVLCVYRFNPGDPQTVALEEQVKNDYANIETLAQHGDDRFRLAYNANVDLKGLTPTDLADIEKLITGSSSIKNSLMLFPKAPADEAIQYDEPMFLDVDLSAFSAQDIKGNAFSQEDLKPYDLTVVNIWATFCGPCLEEMDDLAKLKTLLPANVNLISVCADGAADPELVSNILTSANADFITLLDGDELNQKLLNHITGFPTTLFVDKNGILVGDVFEGAPSGDDVAQVYLDEISQRLELIPSTDCPIA